MPASHVALLRAVNVSGQNLIPMARLRTAVEGLGFGAVQTYLQSGNVVFTPPPRAMDLSKALHDLIATTFGFQVAVLILTREEVADIVAHNPFLPDPAVDPKFCHATLLPAAPDPAAFAALTLPLQSGEAVQARGRALYLHCPSGYGKSKLTNAWFERALATHATTRNWNTLTALHRLCNEPG